MPEQRPESAALKRLVENEAVSLRLAGHAPGDIAVRLGRRRSAIAKILRRRLRRVLEEATGEQVRAEELLRYDLLLERLWPRLVEPDIDPATGQDRLDPRVFNMFMRLSKARRELVGADAAHKAEPVPASETNTPKMLDDKPALLQRFMDLSAQMYQRGIGRPETPTEDAKAEARALGITMPASADAGPILEADAADQDDGEEEDPADRPPGSWIDGRFYPDAGSAQPASGGHTGSERPKTIARVAPSGTRRWGAPASADPAGVDGPLTTPPEASTTKPPRPPTMCAKAKTAAQAEERR